GRRSHRPTCRFGCRRRLLHERCLQIHHRPGAGCGWWMVCERGRSFEMTVPSAFVGLDVGGTNIKALLLGPDGRILGQETVPTLDNGRSNGWRDRARAAVRSVLVHCGGRPLVGVAAPGLPASDGRSIAYMPDRLPGLEDLNWQQWLELDVPVPVFNDAQAALLGEVWIGAA